MKTFKQFQEAIGLGTVGAIAGTVALGAMGLDAIRKMNKNKEKMDKGEKFREKSTLDNIQKKNDFYRQHGIIK